MITLPNCCNCSEITVTPKDWKICKASAMARNWHIHYYFYDTAIKKRKFVLVKGMNRFKTLNERREATAQLIENELYNLKDKGYIPITGKFFIERFGSIEPTEGFIDALRKAFKLLKLEGTTMQDISSAINFFETAAKRIGIERLEIQSVKRRHLRQVLDTVGELKKSWSAYSFNNCRAYLLMLYKKLLEENAVDVNPVKEIPKQKIVFKLKRILDETERARIDTSLEHLNWDETSKRPDAAAASKMAGHTSNCDNIETSTSKIH
jgi:hypothetical protein